MVRRRRLPAIAASPKKVTAAAAKLLQQGRSHACLPSFGRKELEKKPCATRPSDALVAEHFPMMVMSMVALMDLGKMQPLEICMQRDLVAHYLSKLAFTSIVFFISHQWLARTEPDPDSVQLRCLQTFLKKMQAGCAKAMFRSGDWETFKDGTAPSANKISTQVNEIKAMFSRHACAHPEQDPEQVLAEDCRRGSVWIDYHSIPQIVQPGQVSPGPRQYNAADQDNAIRSIPFYIEQSSFFIVLAPTATHKDTGDICNFGSWRQRGWCRLEEWSNMLSHQNMVPLVLTEERVQPIGVTDFFLFHGFTRRGSVCLGDFSCCKFGHVTPTGEPVACDRERVSNLLKEMWTSKVRKVSEVKHSYATLHYRCCETQLFAQTSDAPYEATWAGLSGDRTPEVVLRRIDDDVDSGLITFRTIIVACLLGDERVVRLCVARGDDPACTTKDVTGLSPLQSACISGNHSLVKFLLSCPQVTKEEVNRSTDELRLTAIWRAACNGYADIVKTLVEAGAKPDPERNDGRRPLHVAADHGHLEVVQALIAAGHPLDVQDHAGRTALDWASTHDSLWGCQLRKSDVKCLLEAQVLPARMMKA